ncbi:LuxR C-terminal-related transcriptional regulator [Nocardia sp. CC201C]|uniref:LuxR C-terminal-related transcriptional regulator n=1 Tax=Nocardia sp. CC201C TaxID=3044575 RepID=UPI0024A97F46|nr:LuxR C-terminal-related transcriptional regulator [Nocardia sp. CC201C]
MAGNIPIALDSLPYTRDLFRELDSEDSVPLLYLVRGRSGTGKSTLLSAIRNRLRTRGTMPTDNPHDGQGGGSPATTTHPGSGRIARTALVVDDAHTLSDAAFEALCAAAESGHRTVVIATRPRPHDARLRALTDLVSRRGRVVDLRALAVAEIAPFARELGMMVPRGIAQHIHRQTGGIHGGVVAALAAACATRMDAGMGAVDSAVTSWARARLDDADPELLDTLVVAAIGAGLDASELAEVLEVNLGAAQDLVDRARASALITDADLLLAPAVTPLRTLVGDRRFLGVQRRLLRARLDAGLLRDHTALLLAESGVRDPRLAEFLCAAAEKAGDEATRYYAAVAAAGADPNTIAVRWADAAARAGDCDTALRLAEPALARDDIAPAELAAAVRICAGVWTRRGFISRAAQLYTWLGARRIGADWAVGATVLYLAGDPAVARALSASADRWPPTEATARAATIATALAKSVEPGPRAPRPTHGSPGTSRAGVSAAAVPEQSVPPGGTAHSEAALAPETATPQEPVAGHHPARSSSAAESDWAAVYLHDDSIRRHTDGSPSTATTPTGSTAPGSTGTDSTGTDTTTTDTTSARSTTRAATTGADSVRTHATTGGDAMTARQVSSASSMPARDDSAFTTPERDRLTETIPGSGAARSFLDAGTTASPGRAAAPSETARTVEPFTAAQSSAAHAVTGRPDGTGGESRPRATGGESRPGFPESGAPVAPVRPTGASRNTRTEPADAAGSETAALGFPQVHTDTRRGAAMAAVSALIHAAHSGLAPSEAGGDRFLPCSAVSIATLLCLSIGEPRRAADALRGSSTDPQRRVLAAWVAMLGGDERAAAEAVDQLDIAALDPRDRLLAHAVIVGLARRGGDHSALTLAWQAAAPLFDEVGADLLTLLPIGELWLAGIRLRDESRVSALVDDARRLLRRLGDPPAWANSFHWYAIQAAIAHERPDRLLPHAHRLKAAAEAGDTQAAALADAGRTWVLVLRGQVERVPVEAAVRRLAGLGLSWDAARLASEAALTADDSGTATALLKLARTVRVQSRPPEQPIRPLPTPAPRPDPVPDAVLSEREREVAELVLLGLTYREIGARLYISAKTVEHHVARIRRRIGAGSRSELLSMLRAMGHGSLLV